MTLKNVAQRFIGIKQEPGTYIVTFPGRRVQGRPNTSGFHLQSLAKKTCSTHLSSPRAHVFSHFRLLPQDCSARGGRRWQEQKSCVRSVSPSAQRRDLATRSPACLPPKPFQRCFTQSSPSRTQTYPETAWLLLRNRSCTPALRSHGSPSEAISMEAFSVHLQFAEMPGRHTGDE